VVGDQKVAVFDDTRNWKDKLLLYSHEIKWEDNIPVPTKAEPEAIDLFEQEPLRMQCEHFLQCITKGQTPRTDGHDGLRVLRILNASQRSLDEKGKKIFLNESTTEKLSAKRYEPQAKPQDAFVHPTAIVDDNVTIETGTKVWHFSHILGNQCKIQNNVSVYKGVTLEDGVFCGPSMVFTNVYNSRAEIRKMDQTRPTLVKKDLQ